MSYKEFTKHIEPCVFNPKTGAPCNHHILPDGLLGERVKMDDAECLIVSITTVIDLRKV